MSKDYTPLYEMKPETTDELVEWFEEYQRRAHDTGSGMAMIRAVKALILAGLTPAMNGSCGGNVEESFRRLVYDQTALDRVACMLWCHDPNPIWIGDKEKAICPLDSIYEILH
tara:strand:- start:5095 stop:5433 length:339 start_codon:yes stop_codon:yes gene_type:complete